MTRFSERIGAVAPSTNIQTDSMNEELRNSLWNVLLDIYKPPEGNWGLVVRYVARYFRKSPVDDLPQHDFKWPKWLKDYLFGLPWYRVYDFIEFAVQNHIEMTTLRRGTSYESRHPITQKIFISALNHILERELSGFRFVDGVLTPISNSAEAQEIDDAAAAARGAGLAGAATHIHTALAMLGKKPTPDYRNAIKESISAVESVAKQIVGSESATLDEALKKLNEKTNIHGALLKGYLSIYGYTSDESGIRHGIYEETNIGFTEAKYMVVSCSAFVHYLIQKADEAGLLKKA